jgi:hypothetical protein
MVLGILGRLFDRLRSRFKFEVRGDNKTLELPSPTPKEARHGQQSWS